MKWLECKSAPEYKSVRSHGSLLEKFGTLPVGEGRGLAPGGAVEVSRDVIRGFIPVIGKGKRQCEIPRRTTAAL